MLIQNLYEFKNNLVRDTNSVSNSSSDHVVDYPSKAGFHQRRVCGTSDAEVRFGSLGICVNLRTVNFPTQFSAQKEGLGYF